MVDVWRFGPVSEADFEPLLAIRIEVMREHLERVFRYKPSRARRIFREHFAEPGLRLILIGDETAGCVGFRVGESRDQDRFLLPRPPPSQSRAGRCDPESAAGRGRCARPARCELEVLRGSPADRFYERHGFVKQGQDDIEANFRRPISRG